MTSLDLLCSTRLNLKNKVTKIEHKKMFCGPSKILKNIPWPINICLKYLMAPSKTLRNPRPPPSPSLHVRYMLMYSPLFKVLTFFIVF